MRSCRSSIPFAVSATLLLAISAARAADDTASGAAADPWRTVLGSPTNDWRLAGRAVWSQADGRAVLLPDGPRGLTLTCLQSITNDAEISVRFRLSPVDKKAAWLQLAAGLSSPDDTLKRPTDLHITTSAGDELASLTWSFPPAAPGKRNLAGTYALRTPVKINAKWPELVRRRIAQDNAAVAAPTSRWLNVRCVLRQGDVQVYLDDRLLNAVRGSAASPRGYFRLSFYTGVELAAVHVADLPPADPRFEIVRLDGYLNGAQPDIQAVARGAVQTGGIPFIVPEPNERGLSAVDVGRSWMRFGLLEGDFDGYSEPARWRGALGGEPGRIQFRVPNDRYSKIHLLAAYDGAPDTIPVVTVQVYKPWAGFPVNFATSVPPGKPGVVTIPLEPGCDASFADADYLEFELTKEVHVYRTFPDPIAYSEHGGGLPSGVHVYAITLERPPVDADLQPDRLAHIWTAPAKPDYTLKLRNRTAEKQSVQLDLTTVSYDSLEQTAAHKDVSLAPREQTVVAFPLRLKRYGYHDVKLRIEDRAGARTEERSLAFLHPDTRERGNWEEGKGPLFGFWDWNGGHGTLTGTARLEVMVQAGVESSFVSFNSATYTNDLAYLQAHGMLTTFLTQYRGWDAKRFGGAFDAARPEEMQAQFIEALKKSPDAKPTAVNRPELALFWAEPLLGPVSYRSIPEYYGDPPYELTDAEQAKYKMYLDQFLILGSAVKQEWPAAKLLFPYGIPLFPVPFLRNSKAAAALMDGPALDMITFERLPEMQIHQVTYASVLWQLKQEWFKHSPKPWPKFTAIEGPCTSPATPGGLTRQEEADLQVRDFLLQAAYGTTRHLGFPAPSRCSGTWGETHYGDGLLERVPLLTPKPVYVAYATLTRQLNRMNFVKTVDTGNTTVFALQFKHYRTGERLHIFWTLRGTRSVTLDAAGARRVRLSDAMDNETMLAVRAGQVTFTVGTSPVYLRGLASDAKVTALGAPDHSDARPAAGALELANLGDGAWTVSTATDEDYETSHIEFIKRFPGRMTVQTMPGGAETGPALAIHLEKQDHERKVMPFYTTLVPAKPIEIPGKASKLGIWAHAAGDWGRVVYGLRDARGERWLSVGKKDEWNVDDAHCWSAFCFDGWRYLAYELPGNEPWDCYRVAGSSFWGYYGQGDGIVDLPLTLEKIIVERRTHVIQVDELKPANPEDVLLADLYAEYARPADETAEAVRQSRLRMTATEGAVAPQQTTAPENPFH